MQPRTLTRRGLIQSAAALSVSAAATKANSAVTVGIIGLGGRGSSHARHIASLPEAKVISVAEVSDASISRARERVSLDGIRLHKDMEEVLASDVDAVIIATPVYMHPDHFEAAIQAGKHIYIEKPAAADLAGAKRVMRLADAAPRHLNITFGFQQRHGRVYRDAKRLIDSGTIGPINLVHSHFLKSGMTGKEPAQPPPTTDAERLAQWKLWRSTYGEIITETFCHNIDAMNWFVGAHPLKAIGTGGRSVMKQGDLLDHLNVTYDYPGNVQANMVGSYLSPSFYREVYERYFCSDGVVETARGYWKYHRGRDDTVEERSPHDITIDALQEFFGRVQNGKPANTGVRGAESTLTALLGQMAIDRRAEVTWDEMMDA
ncbi:MAG: Gfo/Idh/MocA family oxidoreductase [Bryobacterales bacterium]|nr:Gfo/Idh/MocA family oxidoreductase [Bryobacterales bacterium]